MADQDPAAGQAGGGTDTIDITPMDFLKETGAGWRDFVGDDLKSDPIVSKYMENASEKDIASLVKFAAHTSAKVGNAIHLPGKDANPEDVAALRSKLYEAGVFPSPPKDPKEYDFSLIKKSLPEGLGWSDDLAGKFATTLHKHGVPASALNDLLPLYVEALTGAGQALKTDFDAGMSALKQEHGEKFDERQEAVRRISGAIFKTPEEVQFFESTGLANHPAFMSVMMRLAPLAMQDSSFMETVPHVGGQRTGEDVKSELSRIMSDKTHPDHDGYWKQDPKIMAKVRQMYVEAYGNAPVDIGQGVSTDRG